jgi:hypothetical protein
MPSLCAMLSPPRLLAFYIALNAGAWSLSERDSTGFEGIEKYSF